MTSAPGVPPAVDLAVLLEELDHATAWSLALVDGLDDAQITWRPNEDSSAMGWHLGHQAAVAHFMVRNLTAAEVSFNKEFDAIFDSATPEQGRGAIPGLAEIVEYRTAISATTHRTVKRIASGNVGAPEQLVHIAGGLLRGIVNHEYQHAKWVGEVRLEMTGEPLPEPVSNRLVDIDGYHVLGV